jgi:hypothetical protein
MFTTGTERFTMLVNWWAAKPAAPECRFFFKKRDRKIDL